MFLICCCLLLLPYILECELVDSLTAYVLRFSICHELNFENLTSRNHLIKTHMNINHAVPFILFCIVFHLR